MIVRSTRYPNLTVTDIKLTFRDGEAEVTDPAHLAILRQLTHMGIEVPDDQPPAVARPMARKPTARTTR